MRKSALSIAAGTTFLVLAHTQASAQMANCGMASSPQMRQWCYQQQMMIYRQQQQYYNNMARQQWQQHENMGRALRAAPGGQYSAPAWNAPRYMYQYRYGRPY
jgi:hypothetical protein